MLFAWRYYGRFCEERRKKYSCRGQLFYKRRTSKNGFFVRFDFGNSFHNVVSKEAYF